MVAISDPYKVPIEVRRDHWPDDFSPLTVGKRKDTVEYDLNSGKDIHGDKHLCGNFSPDLEPPKPRTSDELITLLLLIKTKSANEQINSAQDDVETNNVRQKQTHDEVMAQIEKSIEAGQKAKKGGLFGKIFGWIASVATAIVGAVMIATGVGVVAGVAMLALSIDSMVGMATGHSLMGEMTKGLAKGLEAMGMDETAANVVAAVAITGLTIAATVGAGAASAGRATTGIISKLASSTQQSQRFQAVGTQVRNVATATSATAEIGAGSAAVTTGVYNKQASDARAEEKLMRKELAKLQALIEADQDRLKEIVAKLNEGVNRILQMMGNDHSNRLQVCRNMA